LIKLPLTENWPSTILAKTFSERELCEAIAYLELVRTSKLSPGPELNNLGISPLDYTMYEIEAVQRKLASAISRIRNKKSKAA
jgi:hypothetical protein